MKKNIYLFFLLGMLFLTACENLVEVGYPTNQLGTVQVFEDVQTANAALASLYAKLRDNSVLSGGSYVGAGPMLGFYTDELDLYRAGGESQDPLDIYLIQQQATNTIVKNIWTASYQQIYYANSIIYGAEQSTALSDTDKNRIRGEAILIRSLVYFYLQQLFDDIPYTISLDYEYNRTIGKTDAAALLEQLAFDVTEAAGLLEDDYRDAERIYPNRKVAQLVLAKIYLTERNYKQAEQMARAILQSSLYEFEEDINEVFHKSGKHILWQIRPQISGDATKEASFYYFINAAPRVCALSQNLVNAFADDDLRKQEWMAQVTFNGNSWYRAYKYKNISNNTNEYSIACRLEEAYFIMAEALVKQNRFDEALPYLNVTRERAGLTAFSSLSGEAFTDELLAEKRREFFTEFGHRFLDLKRWGRLNELKTLKPNWEDYKHVWPLPQSELLLNPNLNPQNKGY
ncbi:MAG TPA: RagB/SusD family nutrient uptake outer membrane protein [Petrimonas sp.]|uniref:RagB/SusD family nutrient uptake outer membrane protein n=1 Tax=Petrimonas sp. TaxID=2023866 RepID=UPI001773B3BA|nr:RagB/SusD family nutrient uptake outer membrane protein [Petrimonas sp.]